MYWFQIINLSFTGRNSATFDAKVAEFFIENNGLETLFNRVPAPFCSIAHLSPLSVALSKHPCASRIMIVVPAFSSDSILTTMP